ncbi:MurR/RpiR family transcriptional regulator [Arthrobacter sp. AK01]|uniref:MurR/RpiR family transcriptional regulator n=1 Tax=Micrococcaceae TaxID=1268 RepID=UPI001E32D2B5|nr:MULTISPECIES: MurR/RpiR family transcriptional regulator [Micrococcaceae]MCD4853035.1 MurR/RpiR family transcriptional regulator [Arthrobacter sp. AK01]MCP1411493.1 DNA-binding MurR/RpiR family transcriptional regulator [Paenarthrobacter sp. A20]
MEHAESAQLSRTVLVRIRSALPALRPSERAVAELVLADPSRAAMMSIGDLAEQGGTSTTSVVRFYKKVGYRGYSDLRLDLARETARESLAHNVSAEVYEDINTSDSLRDIVSKIALNETMSIADTAQVLDVGKLAEAVDAISRSRKADIFGVGAGGLVCQDLQQKLHRIGVTSFSWSDPHGALASAALLDDDGVAVAISHSGTTVDTVDFLLAAKAAGATTIAITNHANSTLGRAADIVLATAARETPFRSGAMGSRIAQMMVVDCLFVGVAQRSYESSVTALQKTHAAVQGRKLPRASSTD